MFRLAGGKDKNLIREFHLSPPGKGRGVSCDGEGAFIGAIPVLNRLRKDGKDEWRPRNCEQLSEQISLHYGLPVDMTSKTGGLRAIANALNEGDMARAQIAAVLLGIPDPPQLSKRACSREQMIKLIRDLHWSGMIKWVSDGGLEKAGFNPDEPRDERGRWTNDDAGASAASRDPRIQLADADRIDAVDDPVAEAARRAAQASQRDKTRRTSAEPTSADMASFGPSHYLEARDLAAKLGHGATAEEFLALSSVESKWGISPAAEQAFNFFGAHNAQEGPYPGQTGTYVTSGVEGIAGSLVSKWLPPNPRKDPIQNVAAFSPDTGYMDSGDVVVAALLSPKALAESGGNYSDPAVFFATVHNHGWAERTQTDYVHTMLQRMRHF